MSRLPRVKGASRRPRLGGTGPSFAALVPAGEVQRIGGRQDATSCLHSLPGMVHVLCQNQRAEVVMVAPRKSVFVSYAHEDRKWADELVTFLAPWIRDKRVDLWDDSRIPPGNDWQVEIENAMEEASVAVLLVTKDFLASDFIMLHEVPLLLSRARNKQLRLAWIAVGHSGVEETDLWRFQAVNDPERPLET